MSVIFLKWNCEETGGEERKGSNLQSDGEVHPHDCTGTAALVEVQSHWCQQVIRHKGEMDGWEGGDCRREGGAQKYKHRLTST